jgi:hypothetical protein
MKLGVIQRCLEFLERLFIGCTFFMIWEQQRISAAGPQGLRNAANAPNKQLAYR